LTIDTFSFLRNKQGIHDIGMTELQFSYFDMDFDANTYSKEVSQNFLSTTEAYEHWVKEGRKLGVNFSKKGTNTQLKIVLKAKDEIDLIDHWIHHHESIVGRENLVILDCQSTSQSYLDKLHHYSKDILVLNYRKYYDSIHTTRSNKKFYEFLSREAKYVTVLDADEFLVGKENDALSGKYVQSILEQFSGKVLPATWLDAVLHLPVGTDHGFDSQISLDINFGRIKNNTVAGKSIAASSCLFDIDHLGHNLHVKKVKDNINPNDFFKLFVIHCKTDSVTQNAKRAVHHLVSRNALSNGGEATEEALKKIINGDDFSPTTRHYAGVALKMYGEKPVPFAEYARKTHFLGRFEIEASELTTKTSEFDISELPLS